MLGGELDIFSLTTCRVECGQSSGKAEKGMQNAECRRQNAEGDGWWVAAGWRVVVELVVAKVPYEKT